MTEEEAKASVDGNLETWILELLLGFNPVFTNADKVVATKKIAHEVRDRLNVAMAVVRCGDTPPSTALLTRPHV